MTRPVIPVEAVDAMARTIWDLDRGPTSKSYDECREGTKRHLRREALALMEGASA